MNWKMIWSNRCHKSRRHHRRFYQPRMEVLESRELLSAAPLLHIGPDARHLFDSNNQPFFMVGDTAWSLALSVTESDASYYFQQRAAQGFNTVLMDTVGLSSIVSGSSADKNGNVPFNGFLPGTSTYDVSMTPAAGDTTSSAGKYWQHIDNLISTAAANGIEVVFDVYDTYSPWFQTNGRDGNSPSSTAKLQAYGQFLGQRYGDDNNIIWMFGNDYFASSAGNADMAAVIQGIRQFDTSHVITLEMDSAAGYPPAAFDNATLRQYVALNGIYLYNTGPYRITYLGQYNRADFGPTFNIETGYENNSGIGATPTTVRSGHYSFLLDGAIGDLYGNERVGGAFSGGPFAPDWKAQMNSQGAHEMTYFSNLLSSVVWYNLVPDQNGTVFQGVGSPTDFSGARTADGTLAIAYKPPSGSGGQSFTVHMKQFAGSVTARWYDPTSGTYINIGSGLANSGNQTFTSPTGNSAGQNDFVLVLNAATTAPATPTGLSATAGNGQIVLSWNAANGVTSYNIYRATTAGGEGSTPYRTGITAASITDTGLTNGTPYYYQVSAINSVGQSGKSSEVSAVPQVPAPELPGDYNLNHTVDAADYVLWRKTNGRSVPAAFEGADGNGDLRIGVEDHNVWRTNFGQSVPQGSGGAALALTVSSSFIDANVTLQGSFVDAKALTTITGQPVKSEVPYSPLPAQRPVFEKNFFEFASGIGSPSGHPAATVGAIKHRSDVVPEHVGDALQSLLADASSFRTIDENMLPASSASSPGCSDESRNAALEDSFDNFEPRRRQTGVFPIS